MLQHGSSGSRAFLAVAVVLFAERVRLPRLFSHPFSLSSVRVSANAVDDPAPSLRALSSHSDADLCHFVYGVRRCLLGERCLSGGRSHSGRSDQRSKRSRRLHFVRLLPPLFAEWGNRITDAGKMSRNTGILCSIGAVPRSDRNRCVFDRWSRAWRTSR